MVGVFRDFEITRLEADWEGPGVFLKVRKPLDWRPVDLSGVALYSVVLGRRVRELLTLGDAPLVRRLVLYLRGSRLGWLLSGAVFHALGKRYCSAFIASFVIFLSSFSSPFTSSSWSRSVLYVAVPCFV